MFDQIVGHQQNKDFLERFLNREERPHALLFYGPEGIGKCLLAKEFARAFLCLGSPQEARPCNHCESCRLLNFETGNFAHPDYLYFDPLTDEEQEKKKTKIISVNQIRSLIKQSAHRRSYQNEKPFVRRFLQQLQQRIGRFRVHGIRFVDDADFMF